VLFPNMLREETFFFAVSDVCRSAQVP
jgi:hypothetical protein